MFSLWVLSIPWEDRFPLVLLLFYPTLFTDGDTFSQHTLVTFLYNINTGFWAHTSMLVLQFLFLPVTCQDGGSGEDFTKDSIERDERRLTELGRRTIEIFVLAHIFR